MKLVKNLSYLTSKKIHDSKIGVGFECLERKMWDDSPALYRLLGESGAKHARVQTGWFRCETKPEIYDFVWLDSIVDKLLEQGVEPWFNVGYGNKLYTDSPSIDSAGYPPVNSPEAETAWKKYIAALTTHFRGRVQYYEIWNEADASGFWKRGVCGKEYVHLVKISSETIRSIDPDAKIVGGALALGISWWVGHAIVQNYIDLGIIPWIDCFSFHRYHIHPELNRPEDAALLRKAFDDNGGKHIKLWQGESGCPSVPSETEALCNTPVNENIQAKVVLRSLITDLSYDMDYTCYFHFSDFKRYFRDGLIDKPNYFGLVTCDDPPGKKPAYQTFQAVCTLFTNDTVRDLGIKTELEAASQVPEERFAFQEFLIKVKIASFRKKGFPLISIYEPANLIPSVSGHPEFQARKVTVRIWTAKGNIEHPIVIDPMDGTIYEPETVTRDNTFHLPTQPLEIKDFPVRDYPMFITDRNALDEI